MARRLRIRGNWVADTYAPRAGSSIYFLFLLAYLSTLPTLVLDHNLHLSAFIHFPGTLLSQHLHYSTESRPPRTVAMAYTLTGLPGGYQNTDSQLEWQKAYRRYSRGLFRSFTAPSEGSTTHASRSADSLRACARAARTIDRQDNKHMMNRNLESSQRRTLHLNLSIVNRGNAECETELEKESATLAPILAATGGGREAAACSHFTRGSGTGRGGNMGGV